MTRNTLAAVVVVALGVLAVTSSASGAGGAKSYRLSASMD
jgi:hypothetical protein